MTNYLQLPIGKLMFSILVIGLCAYGQIRPPTPPSGMEPVIAQAIERFPMGTAILVASQGPRRVSSHRYTIKELMEVKKGRAQVVDTIFFSHTVQTLFNICGSQLEKLGDHKVKWCCEGMRKFVPPKALDDPIYQSVSIFLFERIREDPTLLVWNALLNDPGITFEMIEGVKVARRQVCYNKTGQPFYLWRPSAFTLVVVKGNELLNEAVRRWKVGEIQEPSLPWDLELWRLYETDATTWAMRKANEREKDRIGFSAFLLNISPKRDAELVTLTWCGRGKNDLGSVRLEEDASPFPGPGFFTNAASDLAREDEKTPHVTIRKNLNNWDLELQYVVVFLQEGFGRAGFWGL